MAGVLFAWGLGLLSASHLTENNLDRVGRVMCSVALTAKVAHTADEARAVAGHLQERLSTTAQAQIILVTSAFHMRRSRVLCARAGFQVVPFPVDVRVSTGRAFTILDLLPDADSLSKTETALRAWYGFLYYQPLGR